MSTGILGAIGIGKETTYGTPVASTRFYSATESVVEDRPTIREAMTFGTRETLPGFGGILGIEGGIDGIYARPGGIGDLLRAALGAPNTTGAGPYEHVFAATTTKFSAAAALPPYSATIERGNLIHRYAGGQLSQLTLRQPNDDALMADTSWLFQDVSAVSAESVSLESAAPFIFSDLVVQKNGSDWDWFESFQIQINNALAPKRLLNGTNTIQGVDFDDKLEITLSGVLDFGGDTAAYNDWAAKATDDYTFTWTSGANILLIEFPRLMLTGFRPNIDGPGRLTIGIEAIAEYDSGSGFASQFTLTNSEATY